MSSVIVDMQGFNTFKKNKNKQFILKEIAVIDIQSGKCESKIFQAPFPWSELDDKSKKNVVWLIKKHHNLEWYFGDTPYENLNEVVQAILGSAKKIYVKGEEKVTWLEDILQPLTRSIVNIEKFECPQLKTLKKEVNLNLDYCNMHIENCAVRNVFILRKWFVKRFNMFNSLKTFYDFGILQNMLDEEIACLPKEFVMVFAATEIENIWHRLPRTWQLDEGFQQYLCCWEHDDDAANVGDEYSGRTPMKKYCTQCLA